MRILSTALLLVSVAVTPAAAATETGSRPLRDAVTVAGILGHERALQRIANQHGGTRAAGTPGFTASAAYVADTLRAAGYRVTEQNFTFPFFRDRAPATLVRVTPKPGTFTTGSFLYSGSGTVTGRVVPPTGPLGCAAADFKPAGAGPAIALIRRGGCDFGLKAGNAAAAGYDAVVIFNDGGTGHTGLIAGDLGAVFAVPVVGLGSADGAALAAAAQAGPVTATVTTSTVVDPAARTANVLAETPGGDPDRVLVVGSHLDSVLEGPGINDNGSGTATDLEIAEQLAALKIEPRQKVRFAFWGAEEAGLLGAEHYVDSLPAADLGRITANLDFDMLGSPNYGRFVYDGDGSALKVAGPPGSAEIEDVFTDYFATQHLASEPTGFDGRSDYGPFIAVGIPAGGLFSGGEEIKTASQAQAYGGTAGAPFDPCYHRACDTAANLSPAALAELGDAAAHAVHTLAMAETTDVERARTSPPRTTAPARAARPAR